MVQSSTINKPEHAHVSGVVAKSGWLPLNATRTCYMSNGPPPALNPCLD